MRLERNTHQNASNPSVSSDDEKNANDQTEPVCDLVTSVVDTFRADCDQKNIVIEMDVEGCHATANHDFVEDAGTALITNAIASMPAGGELSVTLVETPYQWELEVADSGANPSKLGKTNGKSDFINERLETTSTPEDQDLPHIIEFPTAESIRDVIRLAQSHNATVESWTCPLGGTAWVLVVPKFRKASDMQVRAA